MINRFVGVGYAADGAAGRLMVAEGLRGRAVWNSASRSASVSCTGVLPAGSTLRVPWTDTASRGADLTAERDR